MKTLKSVLFATVLLFGGAAICEAVADDKYFQPRELIQVSNDNVEIAYDQTSAEVAVTAKSAYELYCRSPWLTVVQEGTTLKISAKANDDFVPRSAKIILTTKRENVSRVITVTQKPEPGHDQFFGLPKEGNILPLASLDLSKATHDKFIKEVLKNRSVEGGTIKIKNNTYESAVATHANSTFKIKLNGAMRFVTDLGIDDAILNRSAETHGDAKYRFLLDGKEVAAGRITITDKTAPHIDINTHGAKVLEIVFDSNGSNWGDHIDMGNPYFELTADKPELID